MGAWLRHFAQQIVTRVFVRDFPGYARPKTLSRGRACLRHFVRSTKWRTR